VINIVTIKHEKFALNEGRWMVMLLGILLAALAVATSGLYSGHAPSQNYEVVHGRILSINNEQLSEDPYIKGMLIGRQYLKVEMTSGEYKGNIFEVENSMSRFFNFRAEEGMDMLFTIRVEEGGNYRVEMYGYNREGFVYGIIALFFAVLIVIGRKKGVYAVLSLVFTVIIIVFYMVPRIINGSSPILAAIITSAVTTAVTIAMVSGINAKSLAAVAGIIAGVIMAGAISIVSGQIAHISGLHTQFASEMIYLSQEIEINVPELLVAGIIIASLGAVMDVGMSISSSVFEVYSANPRMSRTALYRSGMNVGRDVMGTMSNTLILAFAGSSLNTLIIITLYRLPYIRFINLDLISVELIQSISSSIGIVLTVPFTALCAAFLATRKKGRKSI